MSETRGDGFPRLPIEPADAPLPIEDADPSIKRTKPCPACGKSMAIDARTCSACGFREGAGLISSSRFERKPGAAAGSATCEACGYALTGLSGDTCPECGTLVVRRSGGFDREAASRQAVRQAYRTPLLMLGIGGAIVLLAVALSSGSLVDALIGVAITVGVFVVSVAVGTGVYLVLGALFFGLDAPLHLIGLTLAGIYATVDAIGVGLGLIPFIPLEWLILGFIYVGFLAEMLEIEISEAIVLGVITWATKVAIVVTVSIVLL